MFYKLQKQEKSQMTSEPLSETRGECLLIFQAFVEPVWQFLVMQRVIVSSLSEPRSRIAAKVSI